MITKFKSCSMIGTLLALALGGSAVALAQDNNPTDNPPKKLDMSRDVRKSGPTADNQKDNKADRETTQKIRKAVVADTALSTYAHNVKIITQAGMVTLRGPVRSEEEKQSIESKAAEVAGAANVKNELRVTPAKTAKSAEKTDK